MWLGIGDGPSISRAEASQVVLTWACDPLPTSFGSHATVVPTAGQHEDGTEHLFTPAPS